MTVSLWIPVEEARRFGMDDLVIRLARSAPDDEDEPGDHVILTTWPVGPK